MKILDEPTIAIAITHLQPGKPIQLSTPEERRKALVFARFIKKKIHTSQNPDGTYTVHAL